MKLSISDWVVINNRAATRNGQPAFPPGVLENTTADGLYHAMQYDYPKFFKMDILCKWAWLSAEMLLSCTNEFLYSGLEKNKVAVVLATGKGCLDADKKYSATLENIPSPSLFVYTLPNIMLGEICIRHGFKGEQICMVSEQQDMNELYFWTADIMNNKGMEACLCGWADAVGGEKDMALYWITKNGNGKPFDAAAMREIYSSNK